MKRAFKIGLVALVLFVAAVAGGVWWYLRDDAPPAVALSTAVESVSDDGTTSTASTAGVTGSWAVDSDTGEFDYESATGTFAGFRIQEELAAIGSTTAVGRTGDVDGTLVIDGTLVTAATFEVNLTTVTTNDNRRDDKVQSALETSQYPTATFTLTEPIDLGSAATSGEAVSVTAVGELTIHGVTKAVEFPLEAQLVDNSIVTVGSLEITFSDYGVEVPEAQVVLSVEDHGILELQLLLARA